MKKSKKKSTTTSPTTKTKTREVECTKILAKDAKKLGLARIEDMPDVWFQIRLAAYSDFQNTFLDFKSKSTLRRAQVILESMGYTVSLYESSYNDKFNDGRTLEVQW